MANQIRGVLEVIEIPFHARLTYSGRNEDDLGEHLLEFNVVGVKEPASATITSGMDTGPVVTGRNCRGGLDLPDRLMDALAIKAFRVVSGFVIDYDGRCGSWTAKDATRWVDRQFEPADAEQIIRELSRHVTPGSEIENKIVVSDDDNV